MPSVRYMQYSYDTTQMLTNIFTISAMNYNIYLAPVIISSLNTDSSHCLTCWACVHTEPSNVEYRSWHFHNAKIWWSYLLLLLWTIVPWLLACQCIFPVYISTNKQRWCSLWLHENLLLLRKWEQKKLPMALKSISLKPDIGNNPFILNKTLLNLLRILFCTRLDRREWIMLC